MTYSITSDGEKEHKYAAVLLGKVFSHGHTISLYSCMRRKGWAGSLLVSKFAFEWFVMIIRKLMIVDNLCSHYT